MRFELIGKTKAKFTKVMPFCIKLGQKETRPAAQLRVMATVSNAVLDKFSPGLREFLFEKAKGSEKVQKQLDGVEVLSDLPNLREPGVRLGALHWDDEQTGCTLIIDRAIDPICLPDCKIEKFKIVSKDGGSVQVFFTVTTGEIDRDTGGDLLLMHQAEVIIELTAPEIISQQQDLEEEQETPEEALAKTAGKGVKQTKAQALAAQLGQTAH